MGFNKKTYKCLGEKTVNDQNSNANKFLVFMNKRY